jgi:hypothetical protein
VVIGNILGNSPSLLYVRYKLCTTCISFIYLSYTFLYMFKKKKVHHQEVTLYTHHIVYSMLKLCLKLCELSICIYYVNSRKCCCIVQYWFFYKCYNKNLKPNKQNQYIYTNIYIHKCLLLCMTYLTWSGPGFNSTHPMTSSESSTKNLICI